MNGNQIEIEKWIDTVANLNFIVEKQINLSVKSSIQRLKSELKFKYNGSNILTEDDIKALLSTKIERGELLRYLDGKANVKDTEESMEVAYVLHRQVKHIWVILIELMRQEISSVIKYLYF